MNKDIIGAVRCEQPPLEIILTPTQLRYYRMYFRDAKTMGQIAAECGVDISTVCRTIKAARQRLLNHYREV